MSSSGIFSSPPSLSSHWLRNHSPWRTRRHEVTHLKSNKSIFDGYFKSPGSQMEWTEGSYYYYNVCQQLEKMQSWGLWLRWRKCWLEWLAPILSIFRVTRLWRNGTKPEGAEQGQISSSVWAACQWAWEWACGCSAWEKGKHAIGCYLGQALEKRAVGLDTLDKYNCKRTLVTVSIPDTLKS